MDVMLTKKMANSLLNSKLTVATAFILVECLFQRDLAKSCLKVLESKSAYKGVRCTY